MSQGNKEWQLEGSGEHSKDAISVGEQSHLGDCESGSMVEVWVAYRDFTIRSWSGTNKGRIKWEHKMSLNERDRDTEQTEPFCVSDEPNYHFTSASEWQHV